MLFSSVYFADFFRKSNSIVTSESASAVVQLLQSDRLLLIDRIDVCASEIYNLKDPHVSGFLFCRDVCYALSSIRCDQFDYGKTMQVKDRNGVILDNCDSYRLTKRVDNELSYKSIQLYDFEAISEPFTFKFVDDQRREWTIAGAYHHSFNPITLTDIPINLISNKMQLKGTFELNDQSAGHSLQVRNQHQCTSLCLLHSDRHCNSFSLCYEARRWFCSIGQLNMTLLLSDPNPLDQSPTFGSDELVASHNCRTYAVDPINRFSAIKERAIDFSKDPSSSLEIARFDGTGASQCAFQCLSLVGSCRTFSIIVVASGVSECVLYKRPIYETAIVFAKHATTYSSKSASARSDQN
jgi:hypothetical protein